LQFDLKLTYFMIQTKKLFSAALAQAASHNASCGSGTRHGCSAFFFTLPQSDV
jgi:hypothetical protein